MDRKIASIDWVFVLKTTKHFRVVLVRCIVFSFRLIVAHTHSAILQLVFCKISERNCNLHAIKAMEMILLSLGKQKTKGKNAQQKNDFLNLNAGWSNKIEKFLCYRCFGYYGKVEGNLQL